VSPPNTSSPPFITMVNEEKQPLTTDATALLTISRLHTVLSEMNPAMSLTYNEQRRIDYLVYRLHHELEARPGDPDIFYGQFKTVVEDTTSEEDKIFGKAIDDDLGIPYIETVDEPDESQPEEVSSSLGRPGTHGSAYESRPKERSSSPDNDPRLTEAEKEWSKYLDSLDSNGALEASQQAQEERDNAHFDGGTDDYGDEESY
jgi:hypothetical protein